MTMHSASASITRAVLPFTARDTAARRTVAPARSHAPGAGPARTVFVASSAADKAGGGFDSGGAMWGGRFEEGVSNIVERFGESVSFDKKLYKQVRTCGCVWVRASMRTQHDVWCMVLMHGASIRAWCTLIWIHQPHPSAFRGNAW